KKVLTAFTLAEACLRAGRLFDIVNFCRPFDFYKIGAPAG
ncbi:hypothetical protein MNBD_ALPHA05-2046, partial [hydrothermal vent metagenome]